jgi:hypothetical protein
MHLNSVEMKTKPIEKFFENNNLILILVKTEYLLKNLPSFAPNTQIELIYKKIAQIYQFI